MAKAKEVWKYKLDVLGTNTVMMPKGAKVLTAQVQEERIAVWAQVDPEGVQFEMRTFEVFGTGWKKLDPDKLQYVGTVQTNGGAFVWHVFEVLK